MSISVKVQFQRCATNRVKAGWLGNINVSLPGVKVRGRIAKSYSNSFYADCRSSTKISGDGEQDRYLNNVELDDTVQKTVNIIVNSFLLIDEIYEVTGHVDEDGEIVITNVVKSNAKMNDEISDKARNQAAKFLGEKEIVVSNSSYASAALSAMREQKNNTVDNVHKVDETDKVKKVKELLGN